LVLAICVLAIIFYPAHRLLLRYAGDGS